MSNTLPERQYVAVAGFAKAGKSEITHYLSECYGFEVVKPSEIIRQELVSEEGEQTFSRAQFRAKGEELRSKHGPAFYLDFITPDSNKVLIDGPRHIDSVQALAAHGGFTVGVVALPFVRYQRSIDMADKAVCISMGDFIEQERPELNDISGQGGQILRILWSIDPVDIIDTSYQTVQESLNEMDIIMRRHKIVL